MNRKQKAKLIVGIIILACWIILISGIIHQPPLIWLLLIVITFIFYVGFSSQTFRRKKTSKDVIEDMEDYMERKAKERLGESENKDSSKENKYEVDDDIKIIKK